MINLPPLTIQVDTAPTPIQYKDMCNTLIKKGKRFSKNSLEKIPYSQLHLCCIGTAGEAVCSPSWVYMEKTRRLERFASMPAEELGRVRRWLQTEGMLDDVLTLSASRETIQWSKLSIVHKTIFTLLCICNHWDDPEGRILDCVELLQSAEDSDIPAAVCGPMRAKLIDISRQYLGIGVDEKERIDDNKFRIGIWEISEALMNTLTPEKLGVILGEQVKGYYCTSDCFSIY